MSDVREAVEAPPWHPGMGPEPRITGYPPGHRGLRIRVGGRWRHAIVRARYDWPDGRVAYQVEIALGDTTSASIRTYWWDPAVMRVA